MNLEHLIEFTADTEPETMKKVASIMKLLELYDPPAVNDLLSDFAKIAEALEENIKTAAPVDQMPSASASGEGLKNTLKHFGGALGLAAVASIGTAAASDLWDAAKRKFSKSKNFKRIIEHNPELKKQDPKNLRAAYDSLHMYAPEFSADPLVGGAILRNLSEFPLNAQTTVYDILQARKNLADVKTRGFNLNPAFGEYASMKRSDRERAAREASRSSSDKNPGRLDDNRD